MDPGAVRPRLLRRLFIRRVGSRRREAVRFATTIAAIAAAAVLTLGACGDDDTPEASVEPGTETTVADTDGGATATAETVTVQIPEFAFDPSPDRGQRRRLGRVGERPLAAPHVVRQRRPGLGHRHRSSPVTPPSP